ncbi:MAG: hypothetical protein JNG88_13485 [Phycisphaerales bacterium]|nr:hypothetical protein [Phycisphaerales bacterium]
MKSHRRVKWPILVSLAFGACAQFGGCAWTGAINTLGGQPGGGAIATGITGGIFGGNLPATPNFGVPLVQAGGRP